MTGRPATRATGTVLRRVARGLRAAVLAWAAWRLLGPEVPRRYSRPQEAPLRFTGRTVLVGHREFFVREAGPEGAPPLVLVHGWSLDGLMTFYKIIPELAERFHLIVPDLRDHGRSDWVRGRYDVPDLADELAGTLRAIGVRDATVLGYSLGGMVVQELAHRHRDVVGHMVLGATAAYPVPRLRHPTRLVFWVLRILARISTTEGAWLTTRILLRTGSLLPEHEQWMYEALKRRDPSLFYEAGDAAWRFDSRSWLPSVRVPATIVVPTGDTLVTLAAQRELVSLLPDAEVVELSGVGHESILSRSDDYVKLLIRIVESRRTESGM